MQLDDLNDLGHDYSIVFDRCTNDFVKAQLQASEAYLIKRTKSCDCETHLGLMKRLRMPGVRIEKRDIDKLISKGWSSTKINRWITEREKTLEKEKARYDRLITTDHPDLVNWMHYLNTVFTTTRISHLGLILHWYKGGLSTERIKIKGRTKLRMADLTMNTLLDMDEDTIYDLWR